MSWWGRYVGIPFVDGGRDLAGLDCWGLVMAVYSAELGLALPAHEGIAAANHRGVAQAMQAGVQAGPWRRVEAPRAFDVMVARRDPHSRYPGHVGVVIDPSRVLHVWRERETHVARLREPALAGLVLGFYRHERVPYVRT